MASKEPDMLYTLRRKHRRTWWALLIRGLLGLAVGIFILARPIASLDAIALIVAIWALLSGIIEILHALETRPIIKSWWILVLGGLVSICFGMAAIYFYPELSLAFMTVWVGFLLATSGITVVYASVQMMNAGLSWIWTSIWGVLSVLA